MDICVKRSGIDCCEKVFEYSMPVEEAAETVVPDTMPDVERILCAEGVVIIRSKDVTDGRVSVSAGVNATVLYSPEGGKGACSLTASIPIDVSVDAPNVTDESMVVAMLTVTNIDARTLNPQQIIGARGSKRVHRMLQPYAARGGRPGWRATGPRALKPLPSPRR